MSDKEDYPVIVQADGNIKLKIEKMEADQLYHCIQDGTVFLFFKDEEGLLNCYEVKDPDTVSEIIKDPTNIKDILNRRANG